MSNLNSSAERINLKSSMCLFRECYVHMEHSKARREMWIQLTNI